MRITAAILASREPRGVGRAVRALVAACRLAGVEANLCLVAPDDETLRSGAKASGGTIRLLRDDGQGKIRALGLLFTQVEGDVVVLTDGDVVVEPMAVAALLRRFENPSVGCVSGHPVPLEPRKGLFGTWAHLLFDAAHRMRSDVEKQGGVVDASGYLLAMRVVPGLLTHLTGTGSEDVEMTHRFAASGYRCVYAPEALVCVRNPRTLADWFRQKSRNARGHLLAGQLLRRGETSPMQSFSREARAALRNSLADCRGPREAAWLVGLFLARGAVWFWARITLARDRREGFDGWPRIESTKTEWEEGVQNPT